MKAEPSIAFVQDALPYFSGAEKALAAALELFPAAPVYTLIYNREAFKSTVFEHHAVIPSWIDRLPGASGFYKSFTPLMSRTFQALDLSQFDIVISFSYAFAHAVQTNHHQRHISYKLTPLRYLWGASGQAEFPGGQAARLLMTPFVHTLRRWDRSAAQGVDRFLAPSQWIGRGIQRAYSRSSRVVYPPVEIERFHACPDRDPFYLVVSRLVPYKRHDLLVEAFNRLGLPLIVVGEGPERRRLERRASSNIRFLGWQPDPVVSDLLSRARAFVYAGVEDFGIALAEAQAAGCPLIAYDTGGAAEIVVDGVTGVLYHRQSADALVEAVGDFELKPSRFDPETIRRSARRFSPQRFKEYFAAEVSAGIQSDPERPSA